MTKRRRGRVHWRQKIEERKSLLWCNHVVHDVGGKERGGELERAPELGQCASQLLRRVSFRRSSVSIMASGVCCLIWFGLVWFDRSRIIYPLFLQQKLGYSGRYSKGGLGDIKGESCVVFHDDEHCFWWCWTFWTSS